MKIISSLLIKTIIESHTYEIEYGAIKRGNLAEATVLIENADHLSVRKTCGCTMPEVQIGVDGGIILIIRYDSNKVGVINQSIYETLLDKETNTQKIITFKLSGTIL